MLLNFLKMELYRLIKMKSTYVMAIIMTVVTLMYTIFLLSFSFDSLMFLLGGSDSSATYEYTVEDGEVNYDVFTGPEITEEDKEEAKANSVFGIGQAYYNDVAETYALNIQGLTGLLLIAILAGLFFGNDYSSHVNKNYTIINGCRWVGFTAKLLALMIYIMAFHILTWIICFISHLFFADSADPGFDKASFVYFMLTYMVTVTIVTMIGFVTTLFKSKAAGVTFGVLVSIGTLSMPIRIADFIIRMKYGWQDFSLNWFIPSRILANLSLNSGGKVVIIALVCAIIYFISAFEGSLMLIRRRDIAT
ncbi:MAG: hypothetical protein J6Z43_04515 [Clostridiales bacterium]|nr:hypothetical protein [Clostridiales bacterium]